MTGEELQIAISEHVDMLKDSRTLKAYLSDIFPTDLLENNLLVQSYNAGITECNIEDEISEKRWRQQSINKLVDGYGISKENAEWTISMWAVAFGREESILSVVEDEYEKRVSEFFSPEFVEYKPAVVTMLFGDNVFGEDMIVIDEFTINTRLLSITYKDEDDFDDIECFNSYQFSKADGMSVDHDDKNIYIHLKSGGEIKIVSVEEETAFDIYCIFKRFSEILSVDKKIYIPSLEEVKEIERLYFADGLIKKYSLMALEIHEDGSVEDVEVAFLPNLKDGAEGYDIKSLVVIHGGYMNTLYQMDYLDLVLDDENNKLILYGMDLSFLIDDESIRHQIYIYLKLISGKEAFLRDIIKMQQ